MDNIEKKVILDVDTNSAQKSIKSLRNELKEIKNAMTNVAEGSDEFNKLANAAGEVHHQLQEISEATRGASADFGDLVSAGMKSTQGLIGGFQTVTSTMSLLGIESEGAAEAIKKMTALLNIQQGISAIDSGIKAFTKLRTAILAASSGMSTLKKALIGTGLGALAVVLGTLIANWDTIAQKLGMVNTAAEENKRKMDDLTQSYRRFRDEQSRLTEEYDYELRLMKAQGKSEEEIAKRRIEILKARKQALLDEQKPLRDEIANTERLVEKYGHIDKWMEGYEKNGKKLQAQRIKNNNELVQDINKLTREISIAQAELDNLSDNDRQPNTSKAKQFSDTEKEIDRLIENYKDAGKTQREILDEVYAHEILLAEGNAELKERIELIYRQKVSELEKSDREKARNKEISDFERTKADELRILIENYEKGNISYDQFTKKREELDSQWLDRYIELLEKQLEAEGITADEIIALQTKINDAKEQRIADKSTATVDTPDTASIGDKLTESINSARQALSDLGVDPAWGNILDRMAELGENWEDLTKKFQGDTGEIIDGVATVAAAGFGAISDIMTALANAEDTTTREGFEKQKKMQIASATFAMLSGIVSAMTNSIRDLGVPAGAIVGAALSTMVGALGGVQIAKIQQTQFDGGNTSSSVPTINTAALNKALEPSTNPAYLTGMSSNIDLNKYVSVVEIDRVRNRVGVSERESRY